MEFYVQRLEQKSIEISGRFFDKNLTELYFSELYPPQDSSCYVLQNNRPNILLIILEGIGAEVVGPLGGRDDVMPNLNRLSKEGVFLTISMQMATGPTKVW